MLDIPTAVSTTPGMPRFVVNELGEAVGVEVWTGEKWQAVLGVMWVSPGVRPCSPNIAPAHLTIGRVLPAGLPWPDAARPAPREDRWSGRA